MGKSRDSRHHKAKGNKKTRDAEEEGNEEEDDAPQHGQKATIGLMPPSDSEDEAEGVEKPVAPKQNSKVGELPPSDSEGEDSEEGDDPTPEYLRAAPPKKKVAPVEERSEEQIRKDLERLELIKKKREGDRLQRIADEGWDRYAPVTETNKPPGTGPVEEK